MPAERTDDHFSNEDSNTRETQIENAAVKAKKSRVWARVEQGIAACLAQEDAEQSESADSSLLKDVVSEFIEECSHEARRFAEEGLVEELAQLAEHARIRASVASVTMATEDGRLLLAAAHNVCERFQEVDIGGPGIIAHVASTKAPYLCGDVDHDPYYLKVIPATRSELAVPLIGGNGGLYGVVNFESTRRNGFTGRSLDAVRRKLHRLVIHLEVLRSLNGGTRHYCPWHPLLHGWSLGDIMNRLCRRICKALGQESTTCTAWYGDQLKGEAFAFATCGYDYAYLREQTLSLADSRIGQVMLKKSPLVVTFNPQADDIFIEKAKAREMGIAEAHMLSLPTMHHDRNHGLAGITVYTRISEDRSADEVRRECIRGGLPDVADAMRDCILGHLQQRERILSEVTQSQIELNSPMAFSQVLRWILRAIDAPAGSIYGKLEGSDTLECLATTGFLVPADEGEGQHHGLSGYAYSMSGNPATMTVSAARKPWSPIRKNRTDDADERGVPEWAPKRPTSLYTEAIGRSLPRKRRLLILGFDAPCGAVGVIRLVRRQKDKPFVYCDEELCLKLARQLRGLLTQWQASSETCDKSMQRTYCQIQQPQLCGAGTFTK